MSWSLVFSSFLDKYIFYEPKMEELSSFFTFPAVADLFEVFFFYFVLFSFSFLADSLFLINLSFIFTAYFFFLVA